MDNRRRSNRLIRPATILAGRPIRWTAVLTALLAGLGLSGWTAAATAEIQLKTESFANSVAGFTECAERIQATADRNLLARPRARLVASTETSNSDPKALTDGEPGIMGSDGRVGIEGQPSIVTYYLGEPKTVTELGVFTFNGDARANQDYEVRLADNSGRPGVMPVFGAKADLTTGDVVLGANGGGFHTRFVDSQAGPLVPGKVDWVQLKIWRTYDVRAGAPAKGNNRASSWASVVEIEVLGAPDDVFAVPPEVLAARKVEAARKRLASISPKAAEVLNEAEPLRRALVDLVATFGAKYPKGPEYLGRLDALEARLAEILPKDRPVDAAAGDELTRVAEQFEQLRYESLLANPLMDFDKLLLVRRDPKNMGLMPNWESNSSLSKTGYDNDVAVLSPVKPDGKLTTLYRPADGKIVADVDLNFDADKMLFSMPGANRWQVFQLNVDGSGLTQLTSDAQPDVDSYDACYLPDGRIIYTSTANMQGIPCIGGGGAVANLAVLDPKTGDTRMLAFEQDHDWCPTVMNNGRVMYLRWEYTDTPHYFTRVMFSMNPDGTGQRELYGSNSYWPNAIFYARPVPGHPSKFVGIVGGHHDVSRMGQLVLFDPALGRREADGAVQRIPGYGKKVEAIVKDGLVGDTWPLFLHPYPLSDKYFLASRPIQRGSNNWGIYLVDVFDNMLLLRSEPGYALLEPIPIRKTARPPVIPDQVDPRRKDAAVYIVDIYRGPGLKDVPRGKVKKLRVFTYTYTYHGFGGHDCFGVESGWDAKRILGTVPVEADGSVLFRVPANTPIAVQPLDENGAALQLMRSWMTAMPGETLSCTGCHESQNEAVPSLRTIAATRAPSEIEPWFGPPRGFGFKREVQPVLDKYCAGCHDGKPREDGKTLPNYADTRPGYRGFSESYHALHRYVLRPGPESDYRLFNPMEYHATSSPLVQMLLKGHHNVQPDAEAWQRLYAWIDLNTPYHATWTEAVGEGRAAPQSARRIHLAKLYAGVDVDPEAMPAAPTATITPVMPPPLPPVKVDVPQVAGWPMDAAEAARRQAAAGGVVRRSIPIGGDPARPAATLELALIPAGEFVMGDVGGMADEQQVAKVSIEKPFWMGTMEITNAQYALFDAEHDSRYIDMQGKDQETPGYPANEPQQPVIRVSWREAMDYCRWLSEKTGRKFSLPTEAQWEWACRAGTPTPLWFGGLEADFGATANLSDVNVKKFALEGFRPKIVENPNPYQAFIPLVAAVDDHYQITAPVGSFQPNPWGLCDMHGNVAEWTRSLYRPYPYDEADGRNAVDAAGKRVVRGGSWRDRPERATSSFRLPYESYQRVFNVGFRVVLEESP